MRHFKIFIIALSLMALTLAPVTEAFAGMNPFTGLSSALSAQQASGPGVLNSPGHTTLYGGNLSVHVPSDTVQLISLSPPSFSAGCSGINMYFGGFSFISGASFGKLIQAIMQAAPGYVINLAIRTLCPECSDILTELQKLAQAANNMGANACHIAKSLVNGAAGLLGSALQSGTPSPPPSAQSKVSNAAKTSAGTGGSSGFFSAFNGYAGNVASAMSTVGGYLNNPGQLFGGGSSATTNQAAAKEAKYVGNPVWVALTEAGYTNTYVKEIVMAMAGFTVNGKGDPNVTVMTELPLADPADIVKVVEFGANPQTCAATLQALGTSGTTTVAGGAGLQAIATYEQEVHYRNTMAHILVPTCFVSISGGVAPNPTAMTAGSNVLQDCNVVSETPVSMLSATAPSYAAEAGYNPYLKGGGNSAAAGYSGCGLLGNVAISLTHAVSKVATGIPMNANEMDYVQMAPFPLYQLINDAAVYPSAATQMVQNYAPLLAFLISRDVVMQWLAAVHTVQSGTPQRALSPALEANMSSVVTSLYRAINADDKKLATGMVVQQGIMAQINEMNQMIAGQVSMAGMAGNMMFTKSVAASVTN